MSVPPLSGILQKGHFVRCLAGIICALLIVSPDTAAHGQVAATRGELEALYEEAKGRYELSFRALERLSTQFDEASRAFAAARAAGDEEAQNQAYQDALRISGDKRLAQRQVEADVETLRTARGRLLEANAVYLDSLLTLAETTADPVEQQGLADLMGHEDVSVTRKWYGRFKRKELQEKHRRHSPVTQLFGGGENDE